MGQVLYIRLTYDSIPTIDNADWNAVTANWNASGYRLPTEIEWMWAAMGADTANPGATNTTGYNKAFAGSTGSNTIGDFAVYGYGGITGGETTTERTNPVGSKIAGANELGLYDMSGNVWEWCWDRQGVYTNGTLIDDRGPALGVQRVARGGSWSDLADYCSVGYRRSYYPRFQSNAIVGFRVVRY